MPKKNNHREHRGCTEKKSPHESFCAKPIRIGPWNRTYIARFILLLNKRGDTLCRRSRTSSVRCPTLQKMLLVINAILSFFVSLVLHELGHYFAARVCAVPIKQAGFGWGPKLCAVRVSN